jgi:hypothetical protein
VKKRRAERRGEEYGGRVERTREFRRRRGWGREDGEIEESRREMGKEQRGYKKGRGEWRRGWEALNR